MATVGVQVTSTGIQGPNYADVLQELKISYWSIFGSDADLDPDTQDGQFLAILAQAITDVNNAAIAVYNSFSPATAQGVGLSSVVKINGLTRALPTNSQVVVRVVGQTGTVINGGVIGDDLNLQTRWDLPALVTIPDAGFVDVTAICEVAGDVSAAPNTLTRILTPTRGWQTVNNADAAVPGAPLEGDPALRQRQAASTALPALTVLDSIYASVAALSGVSKVAIYENDTGVPDANGIPGHSISLVVLGGDLNAIAEAIALKKTPGTGTYGDISELVVDARGVPSTIRFFQLTIVPITVEITVHDLPGYTTVVGDEIVANVVAFLTSLAVGEDSYLARLYTPANVGGVGPGATFVVTGIRQSRDGNPLAAADVALSFTEIASCDPSLVTIIVV